MILRSENYFESEDYPFSASPYRVRENEPIEPHTHDFTELAYIAEGSGQHSYNGQSSAISTGDVFVIEPGAEHGYIVDNGSSLLVYNVLFFPSFLRSELETLSAVTPFVDFFYVEPFVRSMAHFRPHLKLQPHERIEMKTLLDHIVMEFQAKKLGYRIVTKTRLIELFVFLSRCCAASLSGDRAVRADDSMLLHISEFIARHYAEPLTLAQVSRMCGLSASAFSAKFKQHTGRTFIEYRNGVRVQQAMRLIAETDRKMLAIAQEVGFDDLSFFNKLFKQTTGLSPGDYRRTFH
ncbi:MAG: helix-turn-helix domain-containing protein [Paenibacillaceae bacterium]|uniref:AraC family transcriptional regulator n=1 Tax=Paenibacillus cymbidii TaxID=1639034 RepID=UPI0010808A8D|nr:AraC family transcriptional regulator [Paenibacillus cymbidii]MBO9606019.1 helix-turn-helix domain-containing protein [Paenibacillaceae bacterium]